MVKAYLKEKRAWILFIFTIEVLLLLIGYLDVALQFTSILYIALLFFILFIAFLTIRYQQETAFLKELKEWHPSLEITSLNEAKLPSEEIFFKALREQQLYFLQETNIQYTSLEQEKDDILSWIHEVKTPLTTMQLMIDRIEDVELSGKMMYEWLRIHHLLDQQLHQKRIAVIENDVYIEKREIAPLLYSEIKELKSWCFQKGIGFDIELEEQEVLTDAKWFSFILRQLLTNAVKYSEKSEICIRSFKENEHVYLEIKDQGRGIEKSDLPRIFEKGFTATKNHQNTAATGMGLYLAEKAAEALKIEIAVTSAVGEGSSFRLCFAKENNLLKITGV
ncbi:sensor histidine kinase [Oceanobacillus sp. FSL H7-0719]|uniref:sensor histidine kinase n=1 Tax=Oceanobacillus sp. FSL H7-0719 TaxID=2954507 RepID=UPI003248B791